MKLIGSLLFLVLLSIVGLGNHYTCLPNDIKEDTAVTRSPGKGVDKTAAITVKQTLNKMKARCSHGKLLDRKGKQIRFYAMQGCWGNPPQDYLEILEKQRVDIDALKKKYTVIELTCNAGGILLQ